MSQVISIVISKPDKVDKANHKGELNLFVSDLLELIAKDYNGNIVEFAISGNEAHKITEVRQAGETINANRLVIINNGKVEFFNTANENHYGKLIGFSVNSGLEDEQIKIISSGIMTGLILENGKVYYANGTSGQISTIPTISGIQQIAGIAISSTELYVNINEPIILT